MADRVYVPEAGQGGRLVIEGEEAHHLVRVRRAGVGDVVEVFDGLGYATRARVVATDRRSVELEPEGEPLPDRVAGVRVTLAVALPKGDRADWLVEKAVELGVDRLIPLVTARSVVDPRAAKLDRFRKIVTGASKQCGRNRLMAVGEAMTWDELVRTREETHRRLAHPGDGASAWPELVRGSAAVVAIGPEGGFDDGEVASAVAAGWRTLSLGATLLRIETAALVAAARLIATGEPRSEQRGVAE